MAYSNPLKQKEYDRRRYESRKEYWRNYHRIHSRLKSASNNLNLLGYMGEEEALNILKGSKRKYKPSDLSYKGENIEVKTSIKRLSAGSVNAYAWRFYLKQLRSVDKFILICKDGYKKTEYIFLIPDSELKVKNLSISENKIGKFKKYLLSS